MGRRQIAAVAAVSFLLSAGAAAADPVLAKLQTGVQGAVKPVAGGAVFECLGDMCAARTPSSDAGGIRGCKELARQVGAVTSFGSAAHPLSADQLTSCNESARK
jgi:hypothetical protein